MNSATSSSNSMTLTFFFRVRSTVAMFLPPLPIARPMLPFSITKVKASSSGKQSFTLALVRDSKMVMYCRRVASYLILVTFHHRTDGHRELLLAEHPELVIG